MTADNKTDKKKLVAVKKYEKDGYSSYHITFSLVSSPADGRRQCFPAVSCRDYVNDALRAATLGIGGASPHYRPGVDPPIDLTRTRLLIVRDFRSKTEELTKYKEKLFSGKRIVNFYERMAGWEPSRITSVNYGNFTSAKSASAAWLLTGPPEWLKYSHLLSMVTLILRVATERVGEPLNFENEAELIELWKLIAKRNGACDYGYIANCYKWFPIIMKKHKEIFTQGPEQAFNGGPGGFHGIGGINALCTLTTENKHLTEKMTELGKLEKIL
jgi:hypothetical protein